MKQPAPDMIIGGKYRLASPLARGGMGSVWTARHMQLDVDLAIKFMDVELASTLEARARFEREAKAAATLQSPYVVNVQDYGVDDELPYLVMQLLRGEDLEERLRRRSRLPLDEVANIVKQAAKGLTRAHELGIVHRDIKPGNLFIAYEHGEETLKILDFGVAKQIGVVSPSSATTSRQLLGSPHYMSPEQIRGAKDIDHRSDLWSMGVVIFQCVTGALPFPGSVLLDVLNRVTTGAFTAATKMAPELPAEVDAFFVRALSHDRDRRFQSAREMTTALVDILSAPRPSDRSVALPPLAARSLSPVPSQVRVRPSFAGDVDPSSPVGPTLPLRVAGDDTPKRLSPADEFVGSSKRPAAVISPAPSAPSTPSSAPAGPVGPAAPASPVASAPRRPPSGSESGPKKILIIDDDEAMGQLMKRWLARAGFEVTIQTRPFGTLNAIVKGKFDLILLDVHMPAMGGPALVKLIRDTEGLEDTKCILCSLMPVDALRKLAEQTGVQAFISKSVPEREFVEVVLTALAKGS